MNGPAAIAAAQGAAVPARLSGRLLAVLAGLAALGALSTNIILPAFPRMASELGVDTRDMGLVLSSFFLAFAIGQLFVGPVSDRWGRRAPVLGGLALFLAGSLVCAWAPTLPLLVAGRVIQALGVCAASVLSRAIARDLFEGEALSRTLALTMVAMAAAPGFSPLLGSAMEYGPGWRASFALVALLGLLLALAYAVVVGETHPADRRAAATPAAVLRGYATLARDVRFMGPALAVSVIIGGLYAFFAATPAMLMGRMGLSAVQLGLFFASTVFVVFAAGMLAPRLAHRWGAARVARCGCAVALAGALALLAGGEEGGLPQFTAAVALYLFGMGLVNPLGTAMALGPFSRQAGLASSLLGGLQMGCAGGMTALASLAGGSPAMTLGLVLAAASALAFAALMARGRQG
ncbi:multidrug effflux MFS transporter [Achromobacter anxifer]|jgi:DHA1 family bicyclomycin/chloramphenicol resistance-like MFS transporter|uniref:multidrug effflux MFS transporter n=1 Tax=Achromobacter anxifer TaxID=1287737 RepID=UPI00155B65A1|nr:multidrug effflux MFS transporter [Achromobacter anxifer]MDF8365360.1 multidrug effflux MFS transporter [Achromobacter anxifer]CAB5512549.1 Bicyclomycin resistance protein [Achromobacter anxifer]